MKVKRPRITCTTPTIHYPEAGSNMYLLAPDQVYKVRAQASSVCAGGETLGAGGVHHR